MLGKTSLTSKMLILTTLLGVVIWLISDTYQTRTLEDVFQGKLAERFSNEALEHRSRFDRHVKVYNQAAKLIVSTTALKNHLAAVDWSDSQEPSILRYQTTTPPWLPNHTVLRKLVMPRYAQLLDNESKTRELYQWSETPPPEGFINPSMLLMRFSNNQSYLTLLNGQPFLVTVEHIKDEKNERIGSIMLGSPVDSLFLRNSQNLATTRSTVALLSEDEETILVSSRPDLIPNGSQLSETENLYQTIGAGFFDYGSTDLVIRFVSFIPLSEVKELTGEVLIKGRTLRGFTTIAYTLAFILIILLFTRRLGGLTQRVVDFSQKMNIHQPRINSRDELHILEERFKTLAREIRSETEALEYQASHDPLTELPNRKILNERLQNELLHNKEKGAPLVLMVSDLNHFKEINDTLGHHIGDLVLQQAAERLYNTIRRSDTVARLGGDEFSILLPDTSLEQGCRIADKINDVFEKPFVAEGHNLNIGISIGVVESPSHGDDVNILVQRADVAMYNAKRGNYGYAIYDPKNDKHSVTRLELMSELRDAIQNQTLELYYQCKMDLETNRIIGSEALLRWNHPDRGFIHPDEFIPLAEQTGLIKPMTYWVIKEALEKCAQWRQHGFELSVSVNISMQCLHDYELAISLRNKLQDLSLPASACTLELTESDIMTDTIRAKSILQELDSIGINISIDDFGTGCSSLAYLKQLPISEIKIDRSFVMEMIEDDNDKVIVKTIIDLSHNLGLKVVAEGVETEPALKSLKQMQCDLAQGYYISWPVSATTFLDFLIKNGGDNPNGKPGDVRRLN